MADGASSRIIQRYLPTGLATADHVSVSGLDLSRDKQELLVSYESDQIYTFPVLPLGKVNSGSTLDHLRELDFCAEAGRKADVHRELAAYGGHLNRFTFLKVCKHEKAIRSYPIRDLPHLRFVRMPSMQDQGMNIYAQDLIQGTLGYMKRQLELLFHSLELITLLATELSHILHFLYL